MAGSSKSSNPLKALEDFERFNRLKLFLPYGHPDTLCPEGTFWKAKNGAGMWTEWSNKPWQFDFINAGATHLQRMSICANRVGKSITGAYEIACHMTGIYPDWWQGRKFTKPVLVWTGSPTNETSRDIIQKELLGGTGEELGTGMIPKSSIIGRPKYRQAGVSDVVDMFHVRHRNGGVSKCILKTFEQGWRKWQGTAPDIVWIDEEPEDAKLYSEALTRLTTTSGLMLVTYTPLLGESELLMQFKENPHSFIVNATWDDVPHLDPKMKAELIASYPDHEIQARTKGVPMMGEGMVFAVPEDEIKCDPFQIPKHWAQICGIDFGIDHPAAAAWLAFDRDKDILYVTSTYKKANETAVYHAAKINSMGKWIPVAWPHDGMNREKSGGQPLADSYREHGVNMLSRSARYENDKGGSQPAEPVVYEILERMRTGRFKVFSTCGEWFEEYRSYHRKNGVIVNIRDDVLKASFYAVMMRRFATPEPSTIRPHAAPMRPVASARL